MKSTMVTCGKCGKSTPLMIQTEKVSYGIEHTYATCLACTAKTTVCYTDAHIRKLMQLQKVARPGADKDARMQQILAEQNALRDRVEWEES